MPSRRKRIGYLPSIDAQKTITKIANKEKLSQSKVVGILVEEALTAIGIFDQEYKHDLIRKVSHGNQSHMKESSIIFSDLDELISDQGITYNKKKENNDLDNFLYDPREAYNKDLFEQFKQFILFQKMTDK